jgi:formylmethanofuran dehydrogenase subunit E
MENMENMENSRTDLTGGAGLSVPNDAALWEKAVAFHGHICCGLTIGYKAALYARSLLGLGFAQDEEIVCITENDACGVDAIQAMLGCSVGKGNLLFRLRGKQAFSFFNRATGAGTRLVMRENPFECAAASTKEAIQARLFAAEPEKLFERKVPPCRMPEPARLFHSIRCERCGEQTAEPHIRLEDGKSLCGDCYTPYRRTV